MLTKQAPDPNDTLGRDRWEQIGHNSMKLENARECLSKLITDIEKISTHLQHDVEVVVIEMVSDQ